MVDLTKRRKKGFSTERELVSIFNERGIWATRIPVSGVSQPLPDVLAVKDGVLYGFEVKSTNKSAIYYYRDFDNVIEWLNAMMREKITCEAWLAVRFRGKKWRFYQLSDETLSVKAELNRGLSLSQFLLRILQQ